MILEPAVTQILRNTVFDQYQRWHPRPYVDVPIRIIDIDEQSLKNQGQWPWPRTVIADLVEKLRNNGVKVIAFDVIFAEPDRTSPKALIEIWQPEGQIAHNISQLPDHDEVLAKQLAKRNDVVLGYIVENQAKNTTLPPRPFVVQSTSADLPNHLMAFKNAIISLPALSASSAGHGIITFKPDQDGIIRRIPLLLNLSGQVMPSLSAEALRLLQNANNYQIKMAEEGSGVQVIKIGQHFIPTTPNAEIWLHYGSSDNRYLSAWDVLTGAVDHKQLQDTVVFIGSSAQGLLDLRFSPMGIIPGVEVHAQALEQIFTRQYLERPDWIIGLEYVALLSFVLLVGMYALKSRALHSAFTAFTSLLLLWGISWYLFTQQGLLFDPVIITVFLIIAFILSSLIRHFSTEKKQRWIREAFSRYISANLVAHLVDNPGQLELGGERRVCSFVFTDLANFTSLMESIDPADAVQILNTYLDEMIAIAFDHDGTLDRIVGDAVAILFSAPVEQKDHRQRAYDCAMAMDQFARRYVEQVKQQGFSLGKTRIGVHCGEVIVGNFGGKTVFDYRALGDPINTAARLESVNKHLGTNICVSAGIVSGIKNAKVRPVGELVLKGKTEALQVYEPITHAPDTAYENAYQLMQKNHTAAKTAFTTLAEQRPDDPLVKLHRQRLEAGEIGSKIVMAAK